MRNRTKQLILPLLALAAMLLIGTLSLTSSTPAYAADGAGTVNNNREENPEGFGTGIIFDSSISAEAVRTITFADTIPTTGTCWNAGVEGYEATVVGCATPSAVDTSKYDVTYGANGTYPKFPADSRWMFGRLDSLVSISNLNQVDTSNVTDMSDMFKESYSLESVDVSGWNTMNVTEMYMMFQQCTSLTSLDLSDWYTPNATSMMEMFCYCTSLTSLDLTGFDTSNVTECAGMLGQLPSLRTLKTGANMDKNYGDDLGLGSPYAPAKTGYTVTGKWKDSATNVAYAASEIPTQTVATYVADYTPNTYTVNYDPGYTVGIMESQSFTYDKAQNLTLNTFTYTGYHFTGWKDEAGKTYTDGQSVSNLTATNNGTVTLTAQWTANTYTVRLDYNDGTGHTQDFSCTYGNSCLISSSIHTRTGYKLTGWKDAAGNTYPVYSALLNLTSTNNDIVTLYAQWEPDTYTVTFDPNNGEGTMENQTLTYNTEQTLTPSTFSRDGWYFTGWNTSMDGTGTTYADGEKIVNLTTAGNTITLYAQWKHVNATMPTTGNGHLLPLLIITSIIGMVTAIILLRKQD